MGTVYTNQTNLRDRWDLFNYHVNTHVKTKLGVMGSGTIIIITWVDQKVLKLMIYRKIG